jgi:flagella basal body P-ring formation protein FlgA
MRTVLTLAATMTLAHAACISVPSSHILARDLAGAVPLFAQIAPEISIGFAPFPGTQRVLSSRDMVEIANQYGLSFPAGRPVPSVCLQRAVRLLSAADLKPALMSTLGIPDLQLEILEISAQPVPPGQLEFRREGLNHPRNCDPQIPVVWRGRLVYDGQHSLAIWAKVRLAVKREVIVASERIPAGSVIYTGEIQRVSSKQFPDLDSSLNSQLTIQSVAGMVARRALSAGQQISPGDLEEAKAVRRGEIVRVQVIDGGATITLDGVAQSSGNKGEAIVVHNPASGRNFRALIDGPKQVVVRPAPGGSL